jgi:hypothetical protein
MIFLAVATVPIYAFSSGGVQFCHALLFLYIAFYVRQNGLYLTPLSISLWLVALMAVTRDIYNAAIYSDFGSMLPAAHVVYTALVFDVLSRFFTRSQSLASLKFGLYAAVAVALTGVYLYGYSLTVDSEIQRSVGTFNNPNQLGYFAVCVFSLSSALYFDRRIPIISYAVIGVAALFLSMVSLSKAAILSTSFGFALALTVLSLRRSRMLGLAWIIACIAAVAYAANSGLFGDLAALERIRNIGAQGDDSFAGRGYDALLKADSVSALLGHGYYGALNIVGHEVHSTVVSYAVNYGPLASSLIIFVLGSCFVCQWKRRGPLCALVTCVPPLLYGLSHNGSRFLLYWILLAYIYGQALAEQGDLRGLHAKRDASFCL